MAFRSSRSSSPVIFGDIPASGSRQTSNPMRSLKDFSTGMQNEAKGCLIDRLDRWYLQNINLLDSDAFMPKPTRLRISLKESTNWAFHLFLGKPCWRHLTGFYSRAGSVHLCGLPAVRFLSQVSYYTWRGQPAELKSATTSPYHAVKTGNGRERRSSCLFSEQLPPETRKTHKCWTQRPRARYTTDQRKRRTASNCWLWSTGRAWSRAFPRRAVPCWAWSPL